VYCTSGMVSTEDTEGKEKTKVYVYSKDPSAEHFGQSERRELVLPF
jgi:hypothetical protein